MIYVYGHIFGRDWLLQIVRDTDFPPPPDSETVQPIFSLRGDVDVSDTPTYEFYGADLDDPEVTVR